MVCEQLLILLLLRPLTCEKFAAQVLQRDHLRAVHRRDRLLVHVHLQRVRGADQVRVRETAA